MVIICKINTNEGDRYFLWSTVVDAPTTNLMDKEVLESEYALSLNEWRCLDDRAVSNLAWANLEELVAFNRAGKGETCLTFNELIETLTEEDSND